MNVKSNVPPADPPPYPPPPPGGLSVPLFQAPASLVVVWADGPLLVHRTLVPILMVTVDGEKVKSWMVTLTVPAGGWVGICPAGGLALVGVEPPQAAAMATPPITRNRNRDILSIRSTGSRASHLHLARDEHLGVVLEGYSGEA